MVLFPYEMIDLTHPLEENIPSWEGTRGFQTETQWEASQCPSMVKFCVQQIKMQAGIGTHMDAPAHCVMGGRTIDQWSLQELLLRGVVIDISERSRERYSLSVDDVKEFEKTYGRIEADSFVLVRTGWERFWKEPKKYRNDHRFPSVSKDAAAFLLERKIAALGIDTLSCDRPEDGEWVHQLLLGEGKYIVENVANLVLLPAIGSLILTLPLKIKGGTEAPIRLVGLVEKKR